MFDVLVIGSGLAGSVAALSAKRAGARVALASRSWGATAMSTGAIDIAYTPALSAREQTPRTLAEHVMDIIAHRKRHPYGVMGLERSLSGLRDGYGELRRVLAGTDLQIEELDFEAENLALPSSLGARLPAGTAFAPHRGIDFSSPVEGRWGVLCFLGDPSFDGRRVRAGVEHDARAFGGGASLTEVPVTVSSTTPMAMAARFDDQKVVDELARELRSKARGLDGIVAPPVLGLTRAGAVRRTLSEAVEAPVVEALAHMPSVPGIRLQRALDAAIDREGIERVGEVVAPMVAGDHLAGLVTRDQLEIRAGAVVLATGRFISGGVVWEGGATNPCREALLNLPVVSELGRMEDDTPHPVVRETPLESHPLMTAGVAFNESLQPLNEGRTAYTNLWAAGMVLGGFASRYVLCADGVALASGWHAGAAAAGGAP